MIEDDVLREVRAAREAYAQLHNFDIGAMVADLHAKALAEDWPVVSHPPRLAKSVEMAPLAPEAAILQPGAA